MTPSAATGSRQDRAASMSSVGSFPEVEVVLERMSTGIAPSSYGAKKAGQLKKRSSTGKAGVAESGKVKQKKESAKSKGTPKEKKGPKVGTEKEKKATKKGDAKPSDDGKKEKKSGTASTTPKKTIPKKNSEKPEAGDKGKKKKQKVTVSLTSNITKVNCRISRSSSLRQRLRHNLARSR